jgi:hypothetical protein
LVGQPATAVALPPCFPLRCCHRRCRCAAAKLAAATAKLAAAAAPAGWDNYFVPVFSFLAGRTKFSVRVIFLELDTILILAAWPVHIGVLILPLLLLVGWYFGRYFEH